MVKVGVLALQGAFVRHSRVLAALGAEPVEVRSPATLEHVDALILPGGESTTMSFLLDSADLYEPIADRLARDMPTLGTCAGLILLAGEVLDARADQRTFGALDVVVRRNGYGRQIDSFEADLTLPHYAGFAQPDRAFPAVFIRAPVVERVGREVEVLATFDERPVLVRQGRVWAAAFHPELSGDRRVHASFLEEV